jgi:hypothetical protein
LGAQADLAAADRRALSPLPLWAGILAGPIAWALDLTINYALVKWVCRTQRYDAHALIAIAALAIVAAGSALSWRALHRTGEDQPTDGGHPRQRARFMATLGLTSSALFALQILAGALPPWVIDACQ